MTTQTEERDLGPLNFKCAVRNCQGTVFLNQSTNKTRKAYPGIPQTYFECIVCHVFYQAEYLKEERRWVPAGFWVSRTWKKRR